MYMLWFRAAGASPREVPARRDRQALLVKNMVIAQAAAYFRWWHLIVLAAIVSGWLFGGAYLLERAARQRAPRRKATRGRCVLITVIAAACTGVTWLAAMMVFTLLWEFHGKAAYIAIGLISVVPALVISYVVLLAGFEFSAKEALRAWLASFGPPAALTVVLGVPTGWITYDLHLTRLARAHSTIRLQELYRAVAQYGVGMPPASLERVIRDHTFPPDYLRCRAKTDRQIAYFYLPAPLKPPNSESKRLLACDYVENLDGDGRVVLFTNGQAEWFDSESFQRLVSLKENTIFGAALAEAEAKAPGD